MQRHFSRIALAVLLCLIVLGCAPSPQNQKFYIAELPSSSETAGSLSASTTAANASPTSVQAKRVYTDLREWMWLDRLFSTKPLRQLKSLNDLETVLVPEYPRLTGGLRKRQNTEQPDTALIPKNYNVARYYTLRHRGIESLCRRGLVVARIVGVKSMAGRWLRRFRKHHFGRSAGWAPHKQKD